MEATLTRLLYILVGFTLGHLLMGASPLAAQVDCKMILDAESKVLNTPTHMYVTGNSGGVTVTTEMIYAAGAVYVRIDGKWSPGGTTKDVEQVTQEMRRKGKATCRYLKDELVNGEMAAVYSMNDEPPGKVASQVWMSKTKGFPLRQDIDIDLGAGRASPTSPRATNTAT
jgi:hypothetical protein